MILRVLRATSEELGASTITYHQESFRAILILSRHFVHASLRVIFNFRKHLPLVTLGVRHSSLLLYTLDGGQNMASKLFGC